MKQIWHSVSLETGIVQKTTTTIAIYLDTDDLTLLIPYNKEHKIMQNQGAFSPVRKGLKEEVFNWLESIVPGQWELRKERKRFLAEPPFSSQSSILIASFSSACALKMMAVEIIFPNPTSLIAFKLAWL